MKRSLSALLLATACLGGASNSITSPDPPTGPGKHVLFIGNSLTYYNFMPLMLEALADSAGELKLETAQVVFPDFSLADHWADGHAATTIRKGGWHVVVLQQGASSVEANRQLLINYTTEFDKLAKGAGATSALYMVWPQANRQQDFDRTSESYRLAAQAVNGILFPVGDAWREAWKRDSTIPLYAPDGLHPSSYGSYLAALVMYRVLYQKSPVGLPARFVLRNGAVLDFDQATATTLQNAAATVLP